jgi:hypothetical protein
VHERVEPEWKSHQHQREGLASMEQPSKRPTYAFALADCPAAYLGNGVP